MRCLFLGFLVLASSVSVESLAQQSSSTETVPLPAPQASADTATSAIVGVYHSGWMPIVGGALQGRAVELTQADTRISQLPVAGATVSLLQNGSLIKSTTTDSDGKFSVSGVSPGLYGLHIESARGYAANSFRATVASTAPKSPVHVYVSSMRRGEADEILTQMWTPDTEDLLARDFYDVAPDGASLNQSPRVRMTGGLVYGSIAFENNFAIPQRHTIKVFDKRNGKLVAASPVDSLGNFSFAPKSPGLFDVVVGGGAYACLSVVVEDGRTPVAAHQPAQARYVTLQELNPFSQDNQDSEASVEAGDATTVSDSSNPEATDEQLPGTVADRLIVPAIGPSRGPTGYASDVGLPLVGGGFTGPGFGLGPGMGGGFGGGFGGPSSGVGLGGSGLGGAAGLLGLGGLAAGAVALSQDDGFNFNTASLISP
ncbi:MAG: carboxypeptidase-like regulatory domain-containing protein [Pirellulaceae bacterium]